MSTSIAPQTFIDELEEVVEIVSDWAVKVVEDTVGTLSTDGRPLGFQPRTTEEQILEYNKLRCNPASWYQYIDGKAKELIDKLIQSGVPQSEIAAIQPYDIAIAYIVSWSAEMEDELGNVG